ADGWPLGIGVVATRHVSPPSVERSTRAAVVPIHTLFFPSVMTQVPLAANAPSPASAGGSFSGGISFQFVPPSVVLMITKRPSTESLTAKPRSASQKASASKKAFGLRLVNCNRQCSPPSVVMLCSRPPPSPGEKQKAVSAPPPCPPGGWGAPAPGPAAPRQVSPPSAVFR